MSEEKMMVLTKDSIISLRGLAHSDPRQVWESNLSELVDKHFLGLVQVDVTYEKGHEFKIGGPRERDRDQFNTLMLHKALPNLTPSQATDERIWTTLALGDYKEYVLRRWDTGDSSDYPVDIKIFVANTRSLLREHAIGRLWWRGFLASEVPRGKVADPLGLFFEYEDIPGEVMGRSIMTDRRVLTAYLGRLEKELATIPGQSESSPNFKKKYIQGFGQQLNFLAGRFQLGMLSEQRLSDVVEIAHTEARKKALKLATESDG
jgi:hypothetical protein